MFVKYGEKLCIKRYDTNNLKTRYLNYSKRKQTVMNRIENYFVFVKFGEKLCTKRYDTNDLKTRYLNSSKHKKNAMNRNENFLSVRKIL